MQGDLRDKVYDAGLCRGGWRFGCGPFNYGAWGWKHLAVDRRLGHKWLINAAQEAGVKHFVYTSAFAAAPYAPIRVLPDQVHEVEQYLQHSGLAHTILRPTAFMESHAHMLIGQPILEKGKVTLFGRRENPRNFVAAQIRLVCGAGFNFAADGWGDD
ncbi:MAG: NmrA family NAD(P)-binding protein [Chloroflexota bacterium]